MPKHGPKSVELNNDKGPEELAKLGKILPDTVWNTEDMWDVALRTLDGMGYRVISKEYLEKLEHWAGIH